MSKRTANSQLTKDGDGSEGDGFTVGKQIVGQQRATATQMATRRLAKPRGGRRPAPTRPPPTLPPGLQQSMPSPFAQNFSNTNGTVPQTNPIAFGQQSNGTQGNQASASFPPTGASSNTGLNTNSFPPSSSSFTFQTDQFRVNPFAKANSDDSPKKKNRQPSYHGEIFDIGGAPAVRHGDKTFDEWTQEGEAAPLWAPIPSSITSAVSKFTETATSSNQQQESPAASGSDPQPSAQPQPSSSTSNMSGNQQQQPSQTGFSFFPQPTAQQPSSILTPVQQQQQQPASSSFQSTAQSQPSSKIVDVSGNLQQEPKLGDPGFSFFAKTIAQQPSGIFTQAQQQQPASSIFTLGQQQQPATSSSQPTAQSQSSSTTFDMTSNQQQQPSQASFSFFPQTSNQQSSSIFSQAQQQQPASSMFTQNQQSQTSGSMFSQFGQAQQKQPAGNMFAQNQQQHTQSHNEAPTQPTPTIQDSNPFAASIKSFFDSPPKPFPETFARTNQPESPVAAQTQELEPSTSPNDSSMLSASPDNAPQSEQFSFITQSQPSPTKSTIAPGQGRSLFDRITPREDNEPQASDLTSISDRNGNTQSPTKNLFGDIKGSAMPESSGSPSQSVFSTVKLPNFSNQSSSSLFTAQRSNIGNEKTPVARRDYGTPPVAPEGFTEEEKRQATTAWRLKALDKHVMHKSRDILSGNNASVADLYSVLDYFEKRRQAIIAANGGPVPSLAGNKRKATHEQPIGEVQGKRLRPGVSANFAPPASATLASPTTAKLPPPVSTISTTSTPAYNAAAASTNSALPTLTNGVDAEETSSLYEYPAQQSKKVNAKRKPDEELVRESDNGKKVCGADEVSYPSLESTSPGSQTSNMFKNILEGKKPDNKVNGSKTASSHDIPSSTPLLSANASAPPTSIQTSSAAPKLPAFQVPKFGTPVNFAEAFRKKSEADAKKKRKAEEFDSDEDDEEVWERMDAERERAKKQKQEQETKPKGPVWENGKLVWPSDKENTDAAVTSTKPMGKEVTGASPVSVKPSDSETGDADTMPTKLTSSYDSVLNQPKPVLPNGTNIFGSNIFGHLSGSESGAEGSKTGDADADDEEEEEDEGGHNVYDNEETRDEEEHDQTESRESSANAFDSHLPRSAGLSKPLEKPSLGGLFDRISKDDNGKAIRQTPMPNDQPSSQASIFSSEPASTGPSSNPFTAVNSSSAPKDKPASQPSRFFSQSASTGQSSNPFPAINASTNSSNKPKAPFGTLNLPANVKASLAARDPVNTNDDHTWKADSPIKFGGSESPPSVNITSPSPTKSPFTGLFGAPKTNTAAETPTKPSALFSMAPTKTPSTGLGFGFTPSNPTTKALAPPSNNVSGASSRATSPGATTGESATESTADAEDETAPKDEQIDLTAGGQGEEDEDVAFVVKGKAIMYNPSSKVWDTKGLGFLRILKHRDTGKSRMVMRTDPSGKIILNASLSSQLKYTSSQKQHVRIPFANAEGKIEAWTLKVGKDGDAKALSKILEENKSN
ncbi:hypothetical protein N7G274_005364 [Stereocaulon virgatum]|uniref:RanBD1 domain-containing protein n=1 Tax=Stereocaulon virgatum TaxID=373712 RepID=A0ABR4A9T6_9LECA